MIINSLLRKCPLKPYHFRQLTYDTETGNLLEKVDAQGGVTTYTYDANNNLLEEIDPGGRTTTYTYDVSGNRISNTDSLGQTTTYTYNEYGQVTSSTDAESNTTTYEYDASGNLIKLTDSAGAATQYQYDVSGRVIGVTNASGRTMAITYDSNSNMASMTDYAGAVTTFSYDANGNMISQTDSTGKTTTFDYDSLGNMISITDPQGNVTTYTYDANGNRTSQTNANGNTTFFTYNSQGQVVQVEDPLGNITMYIYGGSSGCSSCSGGADKLKEVIDPNGNSTTFSYDSLGRLISETDPLGNTTSYSFDFIGNMISSTDPAGNITTYSYDPLNRLLATIDPLGSSTGNTYSVTGKLTSFTDPNGVITSYAYDAAGRMTQTISTDAGTTSYAYNLDGTIKSKTDANGNVATYSYDSAGRLASVLYGNGTIQSYSYDTSGQVSSVTDASGNTSYSYDSLGRTTTIARSIRNHAITVNYDYDPVGNITAVIYPSGLRVEYGYNAVNALAWVQAVAEGSTTVLADQFNYDPSGNLLFMANGNGLAQTWSYDPANRPATIAVPGVLGRVYSYDANGNIMAITNQLDPAKSAAYGYDSLNRLITASGIWGTYSWAYDANGNRLTFQENDLPHIYTYEANRLSTRTVDLPETPEVETDIYQYDAAGNILNDGRRQYMYGQNNRITSTAVNGVTVGEYVYDSNEQRVIKTNADGKVISVYGLSGNLLAEVDDMSGNIIAEYVYIGSRQLARVTTRIIKDIEAMVDFDPNTLNLKSEGTWVTCYIELPAGYSAADIDTTTLLLNGTVPVAWYELGDYDSDGIPDLMAKFSRVLVQETLAPGSTVPVMLNGSGVEELFTFKGMDVIKVLGKGGSKKGIPDSTEPLPEIVLEDTIIRDYTYYHLDQLGTLQAMTDSTGAVVWQADYDPFGGLATLTGKEINNFRFPGQYYDSETGLHYNWHRYYNPETGRYLRADPIGLSGGLNLYLYTGGNPINWFDPEGLARIGGRRLDHPLMRFSSPSGPHRHEQIWYDDGINSGFFEDNAIRSDKGHSKSEYDFSYDPKHYDDSLMHEAEKNVGKTWNKDWDWLFNNCQDYILAVKREYRRLEKGEPCN